MDDRPEGHEYQDYELPLEARNNVKEIKRCLARGLYNEQAMCREHLDLLEDLNTEVGSAIETERRMGRYNATARHDQEIIQKLIKELEAKLSELEKP